MGSYTPWLPHLDHYAFYHSPLHLLRESNGKLAVYEGYSPLLVARQYTQFTTGSSCRDEEAVHASSRSMRQTQMTVYSISALSFQIWLAQEIK